MPGLVDDLKFAQSAGVMVEVDILGGGKLNTGVHEVNEAEGFVSLYAPETFRDNTTTRKVPLDVLASVTVTDVEWSP